jgi:hypothetical protein
LIGLVSDYKPIFTDYPTLYLGIFLCVSVAEIKGAQYWRYQFISLCDPKQLSEYMIIEVEIVQDKDKPQRIPVSNKE